MWAVRAHSVIYSGKAPPAGRASLDKNLSPPKIQKSSFHLFSCRGGAGAAAKGGSSAELAVGLFVLSKAPREREAPLPRQYTILKINPKRKENI